MTESDRQVIRKVLFSMECIFDMDSPYELDRLAALAILEADNPTVLEAKVALLEADAAAYRHVDGTRQDKPTVPMALLREVSDDGEYTHPDSELTRIAARYEYEVTE
jgi:hypothetical protein